jgi:hypothetical protein
VLAGQKTLLTRDVHDIRYDAIHDEIFVTNSSAQAVMVFRGGATGEEPPIRVIQGPHTQLVGSEGGGQMDRLDIDVVHNEIFIPAGNSLLVFAREANGDVPPIRVIHGLDTQLNVARAIVVDPVHNVIIAGNDFENREPLGGGAIAPRFIVKGSPGGLLIFNRTDNGNVRPRAIIQGPKTRISRMQQMQVYPPKGWIVVTCPGRVGSWDPKDAFIAVWNVNDNGDVPPRWVLQGPKSTLMKPRGVALDPNHKEIIVADMRLNAVLTFYFPEIF